MLLGKIRKKLPCCAAKESHLVSKQKCYNIYIYTAMVIRSQTVKATLPIHGVNIPKIQVIKMFKAQKYVKHRSHCHYKPLSLGFHAMKAGLIVIGKGSGYGHA